MNNENLRGGQPKPCRRRDPIPVSMPHSATHLLQGACLQTKTPLYCQQNLPGGVGDPTLPTEELCSVGVWGSWDRWVRAMRTAGAATGAWVVRYRAWGASRGRGSPRGGRSRSPLAHLQEASEGDQLRPTEPGSGAARGWGAEDPGRHDRRWEQQLQRAHDLRREKGEVSPPKPCRRTSVRPGQELHSPAERPPTGTGGHAAQTAAAGLTERHLHGTSLGTLEKTSW